MKCLSLLLALPLLVACDGDKLPPQPGPPAKPKVETTATDVKPLSTLEPAAAEHANRDARKAPAIEIELDPVVDEESERLPSEQVAPAPPKPVAAAPASPKKKVAPERVELPEAELDLSLPEDWAEELEPGHGEDTASMQLLPPLFESREANNSVQMSGRLLQGLQEDDPLIDGAEINFELKR